MSFSIRKGLTRIRVRLTPGTIMDRLVRWMW